MTQRKSQAEKLRELFHIALKSLQRKCPHKKKDITNNAYLGKVCLNCEKVLGNNKFGITALKNDKFGKAALKKGL